MIGIYPQEYFGKLLWINPKWLPINETKFLVKNFAKPRFTKFFTVKKKWKEDRELFTATIYCYTDNDPDGDFLRISANGYSYIYGLLIESLWVKYWYQDFIFVEQRLATVMLNGKLVRCDVWNIKTDCAGSGYKKIYFYIDISK
jgi:hypothetical protein